MKKTYNSKRKVAASLSLAASLALAGSASAAVLLTDNFNVISGNSQNVNQDLAVRQSGPMALATYTGLNIHHQVGNTGTDVGQPGGAGNSGYVLMAFNGSFQSDVDIARASAGPLTIEVDMFNNGSNPGGGGSGQWVAFTLRREGQTFPVAGGGEFGFLKRANGGVQVFQNGGGIAPGSWDTAGFATADHWTLTFTDTAGTGSAFVGNGSKVTFQNGATTLGTLTLGQALNRSGLKLGFTQDNNRFAGIDNITISGTPQAVSVAGSNQSGGNPFTPSWTAETPNLIAGLSPTTANGNFTQEGAGGTSVLTDSTIGTSGSIGGFATCGANAGNTLIYTLPNVVNGTDVTNIVVYSGWGDGGRHGQYYDLSYSTIAAPTTYIPIATVFYLPGSYSGAPANRVAISKTNGTALGSGVANIKFDFSSPPQSGSFNNAYHGYSEIIVQGSDTAAPPPPPSPFLTQDTLPTYAETVAGDTVVFTAAYSNSPPANVQWQVISGGVTNDISGATSGTLTLNNVQVSDSGSYRLKAVNATNGAAAPSYSTGTTLAVAAAPAVVNNIRVNYASQNFPSSVSYFPAWPVDTNNLSLIYGSTSGSGSGTFVGAGDFSADNNSGTVCNGDASILSDGLSSSISSLPNFSFAACGTLIGGGTGQTITYQLVTNGLTYGIDITNITVFGGWQDAGRDQQKYQVLYSTVQSPGSFAPLVTVDYNPTDPGNKPSVARTTVVPANGVLAHNVSAIRFNWNVSPQPENGWEGYSEILVGGNASTGFVPSLTNDVSPLTASDVVGSQIILTAGFSGATTLQWKKGGVSVPGATSSTLVLNNVQLSDAGAYSLVASNAIGGNSSTICTVSVNPAPTATNNVIVAIATQTSDDTVFLPTWDATSLASSLISAASPSSQGDGDFSGGTFGITPTGGSATTVLTDGTFGTIDFNVTGLHAWVTCMGSGTGNNNSQGGNFVTYTLTGSANGYDITNIMTAGGWNDGGRDQQSYTVKYATAANPTLFIPLAVVNYNPTNPIGYSMNRATLTPASGVLAANVVALEFDMTTPAGENGFSGYSEIAVYGFASANPPAPGLVITTEHQEVTTTWTAETPNLIAGQLPSSQGAGVFTGEGCTAAGMTDGILAFGGGPNSSACGTDPNSSVSSVTFNSTTGWNLTNIVVYTMWHDFGREGQFYNLSYSTVAAPTTFLPLTTVNYNPPMPHDGRASGLRVGITPQVGQSLVASNVAAVKFDFTPQGTQDFTWSGYTEIVLQGDSLAAPTLPVVTSSVVGGNLVISGTGGTPNFGYTILTSTNLLTPSANWSVGATGVTDGAGAFSNAIPVDTTKPATFFRLRML